MSVLLSIALAAAQATAPAAAPATAAPAIAPAATTIVYSTAATPVGTLIADPAAKAVLEHYLPGISTNPQLPAVISMPLRAIQPYAPDKLTDAALASIDADLARLPEHR